MANIIGTPGDDNPLTGTNGKDRIEGGDGNDVINGSGGIDQLFGDAGDDILNGGLGNDRLVGGAGTDTAVFAASAQAASTGAAPVASFVGTNLQIDAGAEGIDVLSLVEQVSFNGMVFQVDTPSLNVVANLGADTNSMNEDGGPIAGNVLANDYDLDSLLQVTGVSHGSSVGALGSPLQGDHGVLTLNANGTYTYAADPDAAGVDTFTYSVVDGGVTRTVTLTITVNPENDAPVADDSSNSGDEDTDIVGTVTATDVDGPDVTYSLDTDAANGTVIVNPDGTYTYTPDADFYGTDSFTFTASDGSLSDTGTVTLTVNPVSDVIIVGAGGFATIQEAVDAAEDGDTIMIEAGTYREQVIVDGKSIAIIAADGAVLEAPDHGDIASAGGRFSILTAMNGANLTVENLTIDGRSQGDGFETQTFAGVAFLDSDGSFTGGTITNFVDSSFNGAQHGYGVIIRSSGGAHTVEISDTVIDNFQKNGIDARGAGLVVNLSGNTITGQGLTTLNAQNGIALVSGVTGVVDGNTISGIGYDGGSTAVGVLMHSGAHGVTVTDNTITMAGEGSGIHLVSSDAGTITGNSVSDAISGIAQEGTFTVEVTTAEDNSYSNVEYQLDLFPSTGDATPRDFEGTTGDDYLGGGAGEDTLDGGEGNDELAGFGGADTINGGAGDDVIDGGSGDDVLTGGEGSDTITGGDGVDTAVVAGDATIELVGGAWQVTSDDGVDTVAVEQVQDDGGTVLLVGAGGFATIQEAIDAASAGDTILIAEGTYSENVLVNKDGLTITGVGNVVLEGTFKTDNGIVGDVNTHLETAVAYDGGAGAAFSVSGSNVTFNNIDISSFHTGVLINGDITGLTLNDVNVSDGIFGLTKELDNASVDGLTINDGSFTHLHIGVDLSKNPAISGNDAINVLIDGTHFEDITAKGFYAETLTNGHLTNFTMTNVGYFGGTPSFGAFAGAGVEINLKTGAYSGIEIDNFVMTNVGQSMRFGQPHDNAAAISIKPRDDSGAYTPVEITDAVSIHDGVIDGTSTGIRTGESNKVNATGDLDIDNVVITNAYNDAQNGDLENRSEAEINLTGTADDDTYVVSPQSVGEITINGGDGADTLTGNGSGALTFNGEGGDDVLTGGSGDDVLTGGEGSDTITGGDGVDTAVVAGDATIELVGGAWQVTSDDGVDTVAVEQVQDDGGTVLLVGADGFATIQEAIDAASAGDTIYVAEGTYAENLVVNGKPLNFVAVGEVVIDAAAVGTTVLVTGDFGGGDLSFDGFTITGSTGGIITGGMYVNATGIGDMTLDNCTFEDNAYAGFYLYNAGVENLLIEDSVFDGNGETGLNSGGHIKLMGLTGDATLRELTLNGAPDGTGGPNDPGRPDYGIEIHGIENIELTGGADTAPIGDVVIENVTITGEFHKSAFAINNYQNLDGLSITNLDLSTASADWNIETTSVLNVDGIRESYDASAWDVSLPDQVRATSLRGEHGTESPADQTITGTSSDDQIWGNGGADLIIGGAGDDVIDGQAESDTVVITGLSTDATGVQADTVLTVTSADGVDTLTNIEAIQFDDRTISVNNGNAVVVDELEEVSVNENAVVNGNVLSNAFDLDADTLTITALLDPNNDPVAANGLGAFLVMGAHGFLLLQANGAFSYTATDDSLNPGDVVTETFTYTVSDGADEAVQTLTVTVNGQAEAMVGTNGVDSLSGSEGDDFIFGLGGNDTLQGLGGDDVIYGGAGNDVIVGGSGDDEMIGEGGNDSYNVDSIGDVVIEEAGGGTDTVSASIDYVLGENLENLRLLGLDDLDGTGNAANNSLYGNTGANTLSGMDGNDNLRGGDGNDVLIGGRGNDNLYGEAGADHFVFLNESIKTSGTRDIDQVRDFNHLDGDRIDLSAIDADITTDGDQAFTFVGAFSGVAGQALMILAAGQTLVRLDVNGDGQHDLQIQLLGDHTSAPVLTGTEDPSEGGWIL